MCASFFLADAPKENRPDHRLMARSLFRRCTSVNFRDRSAQTAACKTFLPDSAVQGELTVKLQRRLDACWSRKSANPQKVFWSVNSVLSLAKSAAYAYG
jgi:hypothetical protein